MIKKMIKKIVSWFGPKYITITHRDPISFETDQLIRKKEDTVKIVKRLTYKK